MLTEKNNAPINKTAVDCTPAELRLLELFRMHDEDFSVHHVKNMFINGTFLPDPDLVNLDSSFFQYQLHDILMDMCKEAVIISSQNEIA